MKGRGSSSPTATKVISQPITAWCRRLPMTASLNAEDGRH